MIKETISGPEIIDLRFLKGRYDDLILQHRKP